MNKVCVLGLGYIGLPAAALISSKGIKVVGVDINPDIVKKVSEGRVHFEEPDLDGLVIRAVTRGMLTAQLTPCPADVYIIAVPTPINEDKTADLRAVKNATESIVEHLRPGSLVILESTVPPGTTEELCLPILEKSGLTAGKDFYLSFCPERVLPGKIVAELVTNDRVLGGLNRASAEKAASFYRRFVRGNLYLTNLKTAETVKLIENSFLDVNIAFANEVSLIADELGIDVWEVISLANKHPRVNILNPGPGVGGHCIAVDPWFLVQKMPGITSLISAARRRNDSMP
ncbi:MAG: nucleotide sugar dehydrogenase, partial [Armatimonadetes bacterium]|nr:nucleotide sugar dehydrogenase [Armatimonadota bacterium]